MTDILRSIREQDELLAGLSDSVKAAITVLARERPDLKLNIPKPGSEPKLNGIKDVDLSALMNEFEDGDEPSRKELVERLNGNVKSPRDKARIDRLIKAGAFPGLVYTKGTRSMLRVEKK